MTDPWTTPGDPQPQSAPQPGYASPSFGQPASSAASGYPEPPAYEQPPVYAVHSAPGGTVIAPINSPSAYPGAYPIQPEHPYAVPALVLGIAGFLTGIAFPIAWILGAMGTSQMKREPGRWRPSSMLTAGKWIGIIGTLLGIFVVAIFVIIAIVALVMVPGH